MKLWIRILLFSLFFSSFSLQMVYSQSIGTTETDTIKIKEIKPKSKRYFDPDRAALLSAVVPGLGQIYNKKYWKLPFVYGGVYALYYFFDLNNSQYKNWRNARIRLQDPSSYLEVDPELWESLERRSNPLSTAENGEREYRRRRDLTIILACASYGLIVVDAYVDAHLKGFKISKDLSFKPKPSIQPTFGSSPALGIAFNLKFSNTK